MLGVVFRRARRALATRYLFNDWYLVLAKYMLARIGFNTNLTARIGDCTVKLNPEVFERLVSRFWRAEIKSIRCVNGRLF